MIADNLNLKERRGNSTRCVGLCVHLKENCIVTYKTWDGRLMHTVLILDIKYIICETIPNSKHKNQTDFN